METALFAAIPPPMPLTVLSAEMVEIPTGSERFEEVRNPRSSRVK